MAQLLSRNTVPGPSRVLVRGIPQPARPVAPPPKPAREDTPFVSAIHVGPRMSADGNGYKKNEPIPESEYLRQVEIGVQGPMPEVKKHRPPCPKCKGTGKRGRGGRNYASHKFDCPCVACIPCKDCGGVGRIEVAHGR